MMDSNTDHTLLDRRQLAQRWGVSISTIKRAEKAGLATIHLTRRTVRYPLGGILAFEEKAAISKVL